MGHGSATLKTELKSSFDSLTSIHGTVARRVREIEMEYRFLCRKYYAEELGTTRTTLNRCVVHVQANNQTEGEDRTTRVKREDESSSHHVHATKFSRGTRIIGARPFQNTITCQARSLPLAISE